MVMMGHFVLEAQILELKDFFTNAQILLESKVADGQVDYDAIQKDKSTTPLVEFIAGFDHSQLSADAEKAYLINAYNILVIHGVVENYPLNSLLKIFGFFDQRKWKMGLHHRTLDGLEKDYLLKKFKDPRLHFALACGAKGCPPLASFAYLPDQLDEQLEARTTMTLEDQDFVNLSVDGVVGLNQIFNWYSKDFGGQKSAVIDYINQFRNQPIKPDRLVEYYPYDWKLNDISSSYGATNTSRYVVSSVVPKGGYELKWFNNLYSQILPRDGRTSVRESFFTSIINFVYGVVPQLNVGFDVRYRAFTSHDAPASALKFFSKEDATRSRGTLATIGPKVRFAPNRFWPNFSIQSAFWIPLKKNLEGQNVEPWVDWQGPTWWTQFFNDFDIGSHFALFAEIDFLYEDIGRETKGAFNRISTPVTGIFSYFPNRKTTLYGLLNFSPFWSPTLDYFIQPGLGAKYQFTPQIELELLYTYFSNSFLQENGGRASTFNLGVRLSR